MVSVPGKVGNPDPVMRSGLSADIVQKIQKDSTVIPKQFQLSCSNVDTFCFIFCSIFSRASIAG